MNLPLREGLELAKRLNGNIQNNLNVFELCRNSIPREFRAAEVCNQIIDKAKIVTTQLELDAVDTQVDACNTAIDQLTTSVQSSTRSAKKVVQRKAAAAAKKKTEDEGKEKEERQK